MREVLYVSKPVAPPWNDSSKNLVRDLARGLGGYRPVVMGRAGAEPPFPEGRVEPVYPATAGGFAPGLRDNARVMGRLVFGPRVSLWHFFFAPNPKSSWAGRVAAGVRRVPTVHTVCSAPAEGADLGAVLFADRTVVLSAHTEARLREAGVPAPRLTRIPPAIAPLERAEADRRRALRRELSLPSDAFLTVYPGDLEFGRGAALTLEAFADEGGGDGWLVMACRLKTAAAREAEAELRRRAEELGVSDRVSWIGETPRIHDVLATADAVLLPSDTLYAKMDYPLVLLEAMSLGRPVVVATGTPAAELEPGGGVLAPEPSREAVGAALASLRDDEAARDALGLSGREQVLRDFSRATMARAYESLYDSLLSPEAGR